MCAVTLNHWQAHTESIGRKCGVYVQVAKQDLAGTATCRLCSRPALLGGRYFPNLHGERRCLYLPDSLRLTIPVQRDADYVCDRNQYDDAKRK